MHGTGIIYKRYPNEISFPRVDHIKELLHRLSDVRTLIHAGGLPAVCAIVFVETGLFAFFLPGDSLLVTAGVFARLGDIPLFWLLTLCALCAVAGDQVGYWIGYKTGQALYSWPETWYFKHAHLKKTHAFYEKYGAKTIVIARFVPIVRTFAPVVAGVGQMSYTTFVTYNVVGGLAWVWGMVLTGYGLASLVPDIDKRIDKVILVVIFLSILPGIIEYWREKKRAASAR
jgi:membrane-associated protein